MSDRSNLVEKFGLVSLKENPHSRVASSEFDDETEGRCFGYLRGVRDRAINLQLIRAKEGDILSFPYGWMGPCLYHPSLGIRMMFTAGETFGVTIRGRNLNTAIEDGMSLFDRGLMRHRVTFIREMDRDQSRIAEEQDCVVERIEITLLAENEVRSYLRTETTP